MKIKKGFELKKVCGENIIIAHGVENIDFTKVITLNESAAFLWEKVIDNDFTEDSLVHFLLDEYEVDQTQAADDVKQLVSSWKESGLVE
ncbi:MAG: PqqD family protein [Bacteroidales bacterium]|nr:PqqD family protein [Bacteroidales bacterium]